MTAPICTVPSCSESDEKLSSSDRVADGNGT
jgi:hypothetical protein